MQFTKIQAIWQILAAQRPYVSTVNLLGTTQAAGGYPGAQIGKPDMVRSRPDLHGSLSCAPICVCVCECPCAVSNVCPVAFVVCLPPNLYAGQVWPSAILAGPRRLYPSGGDACVYKWRHDHHGGVLRAILE